MRTRGSRQLRSSGGRAWVRHGTAAVVALVVNVVLVLSLSQWAARGATPAPPLLVVEPLKVVDLAEERELADEPVRRAAVELEQPERRQSPLPVLDRVHMPPLGLALSAPIELDLPEAGAGEPLFQVPDYVAEAAPEGYGPPGVPEGAPGQTGEGLLAADRGPALVQPPDLSSFYPYRARLDGVTGRTRVRLTVDQAGEVVGVEVLASTPPGVFERAARRVSRLLSFQPALRGGVPVRSVVSLNLVWRLE